MDSYRLEPPFETVDALCRDFINGVLDDVGFTFELVEDSDACVDRIENESRPGFFPFTEGGWRAMPWGLLSNLQGSGRHTGMLSLAVEEAERHARESYMDEHDGVDPWEYDHDDGEREEWFEYEQEWMDQTFFIDIRATYFAAGNSRNRSGEDEVWFSVMLNLDEYGRDTRGVIVWERDVKLSELNEELIEAMVASAVDAASSMEAIKPAQAA